MVKKIEVAVIGAGRMAYKHIRAYKKLKNVEIIGIAGKSKENIAFLCKKTGIQKGYTDYKELLSESNPNAVSITTPAHTHAEIAIDCFKNNCHVLCEKPMSMNVKEARKMNEAANKAKKLLMIGFNIRFTDTFVKAHSMIDKGIIGNVRLAWFRGSGNIQKKEWYFNIKTSGNITLESSIHKIDWLRWIIKSEAKEVYSQTIKDVLGLGINNNEWTVIRFKNDALGVIGSSFTFNALSDDIGVIGDEKCLGIRNGNVIVKDFRKGASNLDRLLYGVPNFIPDIKLFFNSSINNEVSHFVDCIIKKKKPLVTGEDGLRSVEIAEASIKSAKMNIPIRL